MISEIFIKRLRVITGSFFLLMLISGPFLALASPTDETKAGGTGITYECVKGECTWDDLIAAIQKILNWGTIFTLEFSVVVIAVAGGRYMISGSNPGERAKANKMLRSVVIGII